MMGGDVRYSSASCTPRPFEGVSAEKTTMQSNKLFGQTVLVLEDEPLVLLDIEAIILAAGGEVITAGTVSKALELADDPSITLALIDVKIEDGNTCEPVCERLAEYGVPFAFYTGYTNPAVLSRFPDVPVIGKPSSAAIIVRALAEMASRG